MSVSGCRQTCDVLARHHELQQRLKEQSKETRRWERAADELLAANRRWEQYHDELQARLAWMSDVLAKVKRYIAHCIHVRNGGEIGTLTHADARFVQEVMPQINAALADAGEYHNPADVERIGELEQAVKIGLRELSDLGSFDRMCAEKAIIAMLAALRSDVYYGDREAIERLCSDKQSS